jgi:hypothetical protein
MDYPTHAASLPVCMIPTPVLVRPPRSLRSSDGSAELEALIPDALPEISSKPGPIVRRVNPTLLTPEDAELETRRDCAAQRQKCSPAATPRINAWWKCSAAGEPLPVTQRPLHLITLARSIRCATKWLAWRARPPPRGWMIHPADSGKHRSGYSKPKRVVRLPLRRLKTSART